MICLGDEGAGKRKKKSLPLSSRLINSITLMFANGHYNRLTRYPHRIIKV